MIGLGEHIEEMAVLFRESGTPLDPDDIAAAVLDIACAQGLLSVEDASSDLAHKECADQARYLLGVD
jgi:2-polyprenyl-3-methyl-5-hydroxy-6-metoxy-1,4-benzoquinol methylase